VQHAAVYDPVRDRVVVIGGDGGTFLNDVWALNLAGGPTWEKLEPKGAPPTGRREHSAIYDPIGDRVIVYGGFDGVRRGDVWSLKLDGTPEWMLHLSATAPPANRAGHTAIYDPIRLRMVMFGGQTGPTSYSSEAWGLTLDIATPVAISLVASEVKPDLVRLTWSAEGAASLAATVYRATGDGEEWIDLGRPALHGEDQLVFEDRDVRSGERYGYRLVVHADGEETALDPVWVTIPHAAILSLAGAWPNPSEDGVSVRFTLPGAEPARLELFDLRGRRIAAREVGSLGAGEHLVPLADRPNLPAGVYLVRLTHAQRVLTAKALVVR
jgi:catechol 2,3-dioxygenase-like lactoylglutathione lyase family enzyme